MSLDDAWQKIRDLSDRVDRMEKRRAASDPTDTARLDWIERNEADILARGDQWEVLIPLCRFEARDSIRAAIDHAMSSFDAIDD